MSDTPNNNKFIADKFLEAGKKVDTTNCVDFPIILESQNGNVKLLSTWKILDDGTPYLATIKIIPIKS